MEKINFKSIAEKLGKFFNSLGKLAIVLTAMASGYAASEIYHRYETTVKTHKMQIPRTAEETRVYVNGNELMLMDVNSGLYQLYSKDVFDIIFNERAKQIVDNQKSK